jgi:hypothetical protein
MAFHSQKNSSPFAMANSSTLPVFMNLRGNIRHGSLWL